jgi:toxin FitB
VNLLDSNIIIYAAMPENTFLRELIAAGENYISAISKVEVLGYHRLARGEAEKLAEFFNAALLLPVSAKIIDTATALRQNKNISVADAIIAATALENKLQLVTRNTDDFKKIPKLRLLNPFA